MKVVAKKVVVSTAVDWLHIAEATEGFSGADLQALVYNAHLEVVHASLGDHRGAENGSDVGRERQKRIQSVSLSERDVSVIANSEKSALNLRVRTYFLATLLSTLTSYKARSNAGKQGAYER